MVHVRQLQNSSKAQLRLLGCTHESQHCFLRANKAHAVCIQGAMKINDCKRSLGYVTNTAGGSQEEPRAVGRSREEPGGAKKARARRGQEKPGRSQEEPGGAKRNQGEPGGAGSGRQGPGGARKNQTSQERRRGAKRSQEGQKGQPERLSWVQPASITRGFADIGFFTFVANQGRQGRPKLLLFSFMSTCQHYTGQYVPRVQSLPLAPAGGQTQRPKILTINARQRLLGSES
jgi:hypothetical protein